MVIIWKKKLEVKNTADSTITLSYMLAAVFNMTKLLCFFSHLLEFQMKCVTVTVLWCRLPLVVAHAGASDILLHSNSNHISALIFQMWQLKKVTGWIWTSNIKQPLPLTTLSVQKGTGGWPIHLLVTDFITAKPHSHACVVAIVVRVDGAEGVVCCNGHTWQLLLLGDVMQLCRGHGGQIISRRPGSHLSV